MFCTCKTDSVPREDFSSPKHIIQGRLQNKTHPPLPRHRGFRCRFRGKNTNNSNPSSAAFAGEIYLRKKLTISGQNPLQTLYLQCLNPPYGDKSSFIHNHFYCSSLRGLELGHFPIKAHYKPFNKCCTQGPLSILYKRVILFIKKGKEKRALQFMKTIFCRS